MAACKQPQQRARRCEHGATPAVGAPPCSAGTPGVEPAAAAEEAAAHRERTRLHPATLVATQPFSQSRACIDAQGVAVCRRLGSQCGARLPPQCFAVRHTASTTDTTSKVLQCHRSTTHRCCSVHAQAYVGGGPGRDGAVSHRCRDHDFAAVAAVGPCAFSEHRGRQRDADNAAVHRVDHHAATTSAAAAAAT